MQIRPDSRLNFMNAPGTPVVQPPRRLSQFNTKLLSPFPDIIVQADAGYRVVEDPTRPARLLDE
jgi:hypothetical protein